MPDIAALQDAFIPELPNYYRGKVRENYDLADGRRIIIATDRLSAFDRAIASIPGKGQVLTQTARYWFEHTGDICPNHVLDYPDPNVVVGQRLAILPVEIVVRGYLAGTTGTSSATSPSLRSTKLSSASIPSAATSSPTACFASAAERKRSSSARTRRAVPE